MGAPMSEAAVVLLILVPLLSAILAGVLGPARAPAVRWVALGSTLLSLLLTFSIVSEYTAPRYDATPNLEKFVPKFETNVVFLPVEKPRDSTVGPPAGAIRFHVGIDGMSIWLVLLTSLLMVSAVLGS